MSSSDDESMEDAKPAAKPSARQDNGGNAPTSAGVKEGESSTSPQVLGEIPFLITHWLAGYSERSQSTHNPAAIAKIQAATSELAEAFAQVGAFGQAKPLGLSLHESDPRVRNIEYSDMKRTWGCPSEHLETVLEASTEGTAIIESAGKQPTDHLQKCIEAQIDELKTPSSGRTLNDAIAVEPANVEEVLTQKASSSLQKPALLALKDDKMLASALKQQQCATSEAMRRYLDARRDVHRLQSEIRIHERSLDYNRQLMMSLDGEDAASSERVVAQLELKLPSLQSNLTTTLLPKLIESRRESLEEYQKERSVAFRFRHPVLHRPDFRNNAIQHNLHRRAVTGRTAVASMRKAMLHHRFAHVVTINAHLNYPVYCLKFDGSGRYFISGADDYLVKVFQTVDRGAVLVCTLKGHAGVINDIGVSADNGFLATASDDGDVRVWGLRDGCPVAILRGHDGGANMVSWSVLVPYQLVTTGADGLARTWDIREACLRRYSRWIGSRSDYTHLVRGKLLEEGTEQSTRNGLNGDQAAPIPPIPARGDETVQIIAPLLGPQIQAQQPTNGAINQIENAGGFVRNDMLDEGVKLVAKLQHGLPVESEGTGTRATRSMVKVICVSRCPTGDHFVTGSDDGKCRIWEAGYSSVMDRLDLANSEQDSFIEHETRRSYRQIGNPLLTLEGHKSTVTDLAYSNCGDRIVSASQKDGAVRIWSWSTDVSNSRILIAKSVTSVKIELTKTPASGRQHGQRNNRNQEALISCDVACWSNDDTKIMTSQCGYARENASEIIPGSQYIFLWDANSGSCLIGVASAHSMQCPVVLPHPILPSIFCSAGADGIVKIWSWESGECLFSHQNIATVGPVDPNDRGKTVGYLDGHFSPDGTALVLSDDSGRVSYFDSSGHGSVPFRGSPEWMKEQYFSNDYYDLFYDEHGYCVERGSEMPPHLAPRGSRCTHSGVAFPSHLHDRFQKLTGPIPMSDRECRGVRQIARRRAVAMQFANKTKRPNHFGRFNAKTTILFNEAETFGAPSNFPASAHLSDIPAASSSRSSRQLSSNWRWRDYDDIERELGNDDVGEPDSDDEEFDPSEVRRVGAAVQIADGSESDDNLEAGDVDEPDSPRQSYRDSRQAERERSDDDESGGEFVEYMSTNNNPSGPYVADYDIHFFKLSSRSQAERLHRDWVRRNECSSSYEGRKTYTPQVGDSVVYIPRVHFETLKQFPMLEAPFLNWPKHFSWPVVKCTIKNIRYRFPFIHYRNTCKSVVAKLTLELVGVPELAEEREYPWPSPTFSSPPTESIFELSLFENDAPECIMPLSLYEKRISQLEAAANQSTNIEVEAFFCEANEDVEDTVLVSYTGTVVEFREESNDELYPSKHLCGSGYRSVHLRWEGERRTDISSPWEVGVVSPEEFNCRVERPQLSEDEKRAAREALREIRAMPSVSDFFGQPVIEAYSDYGLRVEVPIDLSFISGRLEAGYYSNTLSIVADVRLVLSNCIKYNGENDSLSSTGSDMLSAFESKLLSPETLDRFHQFDSPLQGSQPQIPSSYFGQGRSGATAEVSVSERRRLRAEESVSVLETIAAPDSEHIRRSSRVVRPPQNFGEDQLDRRRSSRNRATGGRRGMSRGTQAPTLEQISSSSRRSRGRSPGFGRRGRIRISLRPSTRHLQPVRHSTRAGLRNSAPQEEQEPPTNVWSSGGRSELSNIATASSGAPTRRSLRLDHATLDDDEQVSVPTRRRRATSRARHPPRNSISQQTTPLSGRARAIASPASESQPDSSPSVTSPLDQAPSRTRRTRATATNAAASSDEEHSPTSHDLPGERNGRSNRSSDEDEESSFDEFGNDDDESDEGSFSETDSVPDRKPRATKRKRSTRDRESDQSEDTPRPKRQTKRRSQRRQDTEMTIRSSEARSSPPRRSKKLQTNTQKSYADPSSSEFDDESEDNVVRQPKRKIASKRKAGPATQRKRYVHPRKRAQYIKNWMNQFELSLWPEIAPGHITKVTQELVSRFQDLDEFNLFEEPVVEKHPDLAAAYLSRIDSPMDFQTILSVRLHQYESIRDAQEDLVLVFANCMEFNEEGSLYHDAAATMMELLESTFDGVCNDQGVRPLRHKG